MWCPLPSRRVSRHAPGEEVAGVVASPFPGWSRRRSHWATALTSLPLLHLHGRWGLRPGYPHGPAGRGPPAMTSKQWIRHDAGPESLPRHIGA